MYVVDKYYKWCYIKIALPNIYTFEEVTTADPELSYVNLV